MLANKIVGSREMSNRFLEDLRLTVSDLVAEENYQVLKDLAHANGLLLHSESGGPHRAPRELKGSLDKVFCIGVNRLFWHTHTSAPDEYGLPGFEYFAGTHMNRHVTWWDQCDTFVAYLNRCQYMLAQGLYGADVLAYYGSASPNFVYRESDIDVPRGHAWDMCNTEVLLSRATTRDGRICLPDGMNYALLYLKPGISCISLPVLRKIERMVKDGIVLVGNPPGQKNC